MPFGHAIPPRRSSGRLRGVRFRLPGVVLRVFVALRAHHFALRRSLGRLRGARQGGAGYGAAPANLMPNTALRVWAAIGGMPAGRKGTDISR